MKSIGVGGVGEDAGGTNGGLLNGRQSLAGKGVTVWNAAFTLYLESKSTDEVKAKKPAGQANTLQLACINLQHEVRKTMFSTLCPGNLQAL